MSTVRPSDAPYDAAAGPMIANVGDWNRIAPAYKAFGVDDPSPNSASSLADISYFFDMSQFAEVGYDYEPEKVTKVQENPK